jgi:hypothetical protein
MRTVGYVLRVEEVINIEIFLENLTEEKSFGDQIYVAG